MKWKKDISQVMHAASLGEKNDMNLHGYPKRVMEFNYHEHLQVL